MKLSKVRAANSHRTVAGTKVPKAGTSGFGMRMRRASGGACMSVEGDKPKARLDRPMRAKGGRVGRASGGGVEEDNDKENVVSKHYEDQRKTEKIKGMGWGTGAGLAGTVALLDPDPISKGLATGATIVGALSSKAAFDAADKAEKTRDMWRKSKLPDPSPATTGRKSGGSVPKMESKASAVEKHDDEEEDRKLMRSMVKPSALRAKGGNVKKDC